MLAQIKDTSHSISLGNVSFLSREDNFARRKLKEAIEIHKYAPNLNFDQVWTIQTVILNLFPRSSKEGPVLPGAHG